jgi:hypothetical protein
MEASFSRSSGETKNPKEPTDNDVEMDDDSIDWNTFMIGSLFVFIVGMLCLRGILRDLYKKPKAVATGAKRRL